jgi:uncharacterized protein DUF6582/Mu-like prophage I protein
MTHALNAAADPKKPYGDVEYADPGYQSDGKKRYPIDSLAHCKAAWSYVSMPKNAARYTAEQLASIKAKIKAAGKEYGIEFSEDVKAAAGADLLGVELARPGVWKLKSGETEFTAEMLRDAADFFAASGGQGVPIKLGHDDSRFTGDGEPAFGSVTNVRYAEDDRGPVLLGDLVHMPGWLSASAPRSWPNRSVEGWENFEYQGREYSLVLSGLAFLGVTPPGVRNIKSLADLQVALAASSALRIVASAPPDDPAEPPPDEPDETPEAIPEAPEAAAPGLLAAQPKTPAPEAEEPPTPKEAGQMTLDPVKIREALGLQSDASDDEVTAALVAAGLATASPPSGPEPAPEPVNASGTQELDRRIAAAAAKGGLVTIDPTQLQELRDAVVRASAVTKRLEARDRDEAIAAAVKAGKFPPSRREHYERYWDADPVGAKEVIASLATGLVPVAASGYDTDRDRDDDELDREIARLSGPRPSRKVA